MSYKNFLIVASKQDKAGINITTILSQFRPNPFLEGMKNPDSREAIFDFYLIEEDILDEKNLDLEKINQYDFIIFCSKHVSESQEKTLSIHAPGNVAGKFSPTSAQFLKQTLEKLHKIAKEHHLEDKYKITLEATHHGPIISKPCMFIEIGSTEFEWNDRRAAFVIAKTISQIIEEFKIGEFNENAIGIGGPHYCPVFNKIQKNSNYAISHILPKYSLPLTEEVLKQMIENTEEEIDLAILDWKGLGKKEIREATLKVLDDLHIYYRKSGELK